MSGEKFYVVIAQRACDDPYYPPYADTIGTYKSKEKAIERARLCRKKTKKYSSPDDCYYVEEHTFDDDVKFKDYSSSESSDEDMKKYQYRGEDEETYFGENDKQYKQGGMVYVISRKCDKDSKNE